MRLRIAFLSAPSSASAPLAPYGAPAPRSPDACNTRRTEQNHNLLKTHQNSDDHSADHMLRHARQTLQDGRTGVACSGSSFRLQQKLRFIQPLRMLCWAYRGLMG
ncbi:hypothetical protein GOX2705 (plasmid) [Gluconobacter oxydans 621H]|uniref:Uncharacterized protein n=1 Tax=Gluconobacter oxydans (strain 621H) TaxID=290633 RepID=Q5HXI4_GLUOX|nr:hypothetical protein GOX2705 [Gluconobacter oxydans 621H]